MRLQETLTHDAAPQDVLALFLDPAFHDRVSRATHASDTRVDVQGDTAGSPVVTVRRTVATVGAPDAVRKLVGPSVQVIQTTRWSSAAPDGSRRGDMGLEIDGLPLSAAGVTSLSPEGPRTRQTVEVDLTSRVPLVGGRIVQAVHPILSSALLAEHQVAREALAGR